MRQDIFGVMLTCGALQLQLCFLYANVIMNRIHIYITSQYSVIHHMFLLYSIMHLRLLRPHNPNSPSQVVCHSIHEWQPAFVIPPALKSHLLQNASVAVSINEKTSEIHITGLSKKGFLCTLRQVYIERSTHCSHFPSENTPSPIAVQLWHNYTSRTSYYDQDLKSFEIFLQSPSKMVCLRETLLNARITWSKYKSQDISANPWKGLWVQF